MAKRFTKWITWIGLLGAGMVVAVGSRTTDAAAAPSATDHANAPAGDTKTATLHVEKMMCQACAARIREALTKTDGVQAVDAAPAEKRVVVKFDPAKTDIAKLIAELKKAGFDAEEVKS